jgi:DNA-binding response OmpR family regulator
MTATLNVLIVEDEPLIAMMIENFLEALDHQVAGIADTVSSALEIVSAGGVDVAILDRNLRAGETSVPIAEELERLGVPFILASGGGIAEDPAVFRGRPVLAKPFTLSGLEKVLGAL